MRTLYRDVKRKVLQMGFRRVLLTLPHLIFWKFKYMWVRNRTLSVEDRRFDRAHGVETSRIVRTGSLDIADDLLPQVIRYEPSPVALLRVMLDSLAIDCRRFVFVDIGAGKGRALMMAAEYGFKELIGIEISRALAEQGRRNMEAFTRSLARPVTWSILHLDARQYQFPAENLVIYLYNPCAPQMLGSVLEQVENRIKRSPNEVIVAYYWPYFRNVFDGSPLLQVASQDSHSVIYHSRSEDADSHSSERDLVQH